MAETYHPRGVLVNGYAVQEHPLYYVWADMKARCTDPKQKSYKNYGGRGIKYCARWKHFINFASDMFPSFFNGALLERKDNNKGYSPINCTWATPSQQCHNRRKFSNNTTGHTGIVKQKRGYGARYDDKNKRFDLGNFDTIEEAIKARNKFIQLYSVGDERCKTMLSKGNADRRLRLDSTTGIKGITRSACGYMVRKHVNGRRVYLGVAKTLVAARKLLEAA